MSVRVAYAREFGKYVGTDCLNLGCGANPESGWSNVDFNPCDAGVIAFDLRSRPWPLGREAFDTVKAEHLLEHFSGEELFGVMAEIGQVLRVGGYLIGVVPYATHSVAYANPFHRQLWDQSTPSQFARTLYEVPDSPGTGAHQFMPLADWKLIEIGLIPDHYWKNKSLDEITEAMKGHLNVIVEMWFVMRRES
jgi:hypothetical protein